MIMSLHQRGDGHKVFGADSVDISVGLILSSVQDTHRIGRLKLNLHGYNIWA